MKNRSVTLMCLALGVIGAGCSGGAGGSKGAAQLVGVWREESEFNGPPTQRPIDKRPTIEFTEKTYVRTYPQSSGKPLTGAWSIKQEEGNALVVGMTMKLDKGELKVDDQKITLVGPDVIEIRNSKNGSGGVYKRAGSSAEAAAPSTPSSAAPTPSSAAPTPSSAAPTPSSGGGDPCVTATRCCRAMAGESSAMCASLAKAKPEVCTKTLASLRKSVETSMPAKRGECE